MVELKEMKDINKAIEANIEKDDVADIVPSKTSIKESERHCNVLLNGLKLEKFIAFSTLTITMGGYPCCLMGLIGSTH